MISVWFFGRIWCWISTSIYRI